MNIFANLLDKYLGTYIRVWTYFANIVLNWKQLKLKQRKIIKQINTTEWIHHKYLFPTRF